MTATETEIEEIAAPSKDVQVFFSRSDNLRVVRFPTLRPVTASGQQVTLSPGLSYQFHGHVFRVTPEQRKIDERFIAKYGEHYDPDTLADEFLSTEDWLRERGGITNDFYEMGFQKPDSGPLLQRIATLAIDGLVDELVELYKEEEAEHQRPEVLEAIEHALLRLEEKRKRDAEVEEQIKATAQAEAEAAAGAAGDAAPPPQG